MIETRDLTKTFDNFTAVDSLNLKIEKGEFFGLLGPNGAGKTTTISLLSTLLLPTKGEILIDGQQLTRQRPDLKRKISVITQEYSMRQDMNMDEIMRPQRMRRITVCDSMAAPRPSASSPAAKAAFPPRKRPRPAKRDAYKSAWGRASCVVRPRRWRRSLR